MSDERPRTHECLDAETLAAFIDARLEPREREAVEAHLAECEDCYEVWMEGNAISASFTPLQTEQAASTFWTWAVRIAGVAAVILLTANGPAWISDFRLARHVNQLAQVQRTHRLSDGRLSIDTSWAPVAPTLRSTRELSENYELRSAALALAEFASDEQSWKRAHAHGLALLASGEMDQSISALQRAIAAAPADEVPIKTDLAAALLARYRQSGSLADAVEASTLATRALQLAPTSLVASFNRAAALEAVNPREAVQAWQDYLALDRAPNSEWRREALRRSTIR